MEYGDKAAESWARLEQLLGPVSRKDLINWKLLRYRPTDFDNRPLEAEDWQDTKALVEKMDRMLSVRTENINKVEHVQEAQTQRSRKSMRSSLDSKEKFQLRKVHRRWGRQAWFCTSNSCPMKGITVEKPNVNSVGDDVTNFSDSSYAHSGDKNNKGSFLYISGFLIDTGSMFSIVPPSHLPKNKEISNCSASLRAANNTKIRVHGRLVSKVVIGTEKFETFLFGRRGIRAAIRS